MTTIAILNPAEWIPKIGDLLSANWAETGLDYAFAPDIEAYQRMYDAGFVFAVAAFVEGAVVGYCTVAVTPHTHNPAIVWASNDALFVSPAYRHGTIAPRLMREAEAEAKRRGASRFSWHCRAGTAFAEMLTRHGYTPVDVVVAKEI